MNLLVFTTLYPNAKQPHHGVFVENRLRHLLASSGYTATVVAPIPWFPSKHPSFGAYAEAAAVPRRETRHGLEVYHPRYPLLPKVGMNAAPFALYAAARRCVRQLMAEGRWFDLIDAHYFYPDGVAAALLARDLAKPFVVTGRGTDLNFIPRYALPRRMIRWAAQRADGLVTVCDALRDDLAALGVSRASATVLRNGVDLDVFRRDPASAAALRADLDAPVLLSVGHLIPRKGHDLVIRLLAQLGRGTLLLVGTGPEETRLRALAQQLGIADRVRFEGRVPHEELPRYYSAADALILASSREGWPNVLLESLSCGTPVVATPVNGTPEVIQDPVAGRVTSDRSVEELLAALQDLLAHPVDIAAVRRYAESFSWDATSRGQMALFERIVSGRNR